MMAVAELDYPYTTGANWRRPGCGDGCRLELVTQPGTGRRVWIEVHPPEVHETYGARLSAPPSIVETGPLRIDCNAGIVTLNGRAVTLMPLGWQMLRYFGQRLGRWCPPREVTAAVWGPDKRHDINPARSALYRLRSSLAPYGAMVEAHQQRGWRLRDLPPGTTDGLVLRPWSPQGECCRECGTVERPHHAYGLCTQCGGRAYRRGETA